MIKVLALLAQRAAYTQHSMPIAHMDCGIHGYNFPCYHPAAKCCCPAGADGKGQTEVPACHGQSQAGEGMHVYLQSYTNVASE